VKVFSYKLPTCCAIIFENNPSGENIMALDIYVGGFARYFARDWENIAQKMARENGMEYRMIGPGGAPQPIDRKEVEEAVVLWKAVMNNSLGNNISAPLEWDESSAAPYFTDRPGYDGYGALLVWAAHAELGTTPPETYDGEWHSDKTFLECSKPKKGQKYRPILCGSLWLPGEFEFSFNGQDLAGQDSHICSNGSLVRSLRDLNTNTFGMSDDGLQGALRADFGDAPSLSTLAKFGLALFQDLALKSVEYRLPIIVSN
jgi:hypothetical protein